jgi:hypothetical protein
MVSRRKPSPKQVALLSRLKIANIPTTMAACSTLIGYLLHGENSVYREVRNRLDNYKKWPGSRVKVKARGNTYSGQAGQVVRLQMRSREEIEVLTKEHCGCPPDPFVVIVDIDSHHRPVKFPTSALRIISHRDQRFLFPLNEAVDDEQVTVITQ